MTQSRKRPATPSISTESTKVPRTVPLKAKPRPSIVGTKASQARAKAIKSAQLSSSRAAAAHGPSRTTLKKRPTALVESNPLAKSYHTKASGLKQRPAWDLRGKVEDMTNMLKLNLDRLEELTRYKRELEITKEEKESQEKEAIQKAAALRTEILNLERNHSTDIADLHANQRIEYQQLEDDHLNYARRLNTIAIEVEDARNRLNSVLTQLDHIQLENQSLKETIEKTEASYQNTEAETRTLQAKINKLGVSITDREVEIRKKKAEIDIVNSSVQELQNKLQESHSVRDRLLNIVKCLEENANSKRAVTKLSAF